MHADIEIHNAAKLNMPHLRRDNGTGARSALNKLLVDFSKLIPEEFFATDFHR